MAPLENSLRDRKAIKSCSVEHNSKNYPKKTRKSSEFSISFVPLTKMAENHEKRERLGVVCALNQGAPTADQNVRC